MFSRYSSRITYDVFFFVIIIVLLLNIIFGIIIDTFGKLREDASEKRRLQNDFCFICGISRDVFEAVTYDHKVQTTRTEFNSAFKTHIKTEHNMWDYVFFLIYLKTKNPNNFLGIERFVWLNAYFECYFLSFIFKLRCVETKAR